MQKLYIFILISAIVCLNGSAGKMPDKNFSLSGTNSEPGLMSTTSRNTPRTALNNVVEKRPKRSRAPTPRDVGNSKNATQVGDTVTSLHRLPSRHHTDMPTCIEYSTPSCTIMQPLLTNNAIIQRKNTLLDGLLNDSPTDEELCYNVSDLLGRRISESLGNALSYTKTRNEKKIICGEFMSNILNEIVNYKVLAIDGGGIKGIVSCLILQAIQDKLGKPIIHEFNVVVGTSIGAIITVGLLLQDKDCSPLYEPKDIAQILSDNAKIVFPDKYFKSFRNLFGPKYSSKPLKALLAKLINNEDPPSEIALNLTNFRAGNTIRTLFDIQNRCGGTEIVFPTYDASSNVIKMFRSSERQHSMIKANYSLVDLCMATTAAPTYFATYTFTSLTSPGFQHNCIDGGLFSNSPSMVAVHDIYHNLTDNTNVKPRIWLLSVSAGFAQKNTLDNRSKNFGIADWLRRGLVGTFMQSNTQFCDCICQEILHYYRRLSPVLKETSNKFDDASDANLAHMKRDVENFIITADHTINEIIGSIFNNPTLDNPMFPNIQQVNI